MRPVVQAPPSFGVLDFIRSIPRSVFGMRQVVNDMIAADFDWHAVLRAFFAVILPVNILYYLAEEAVSGSLIDDGMRNDIGYVGALVLMIIIVAMMLIALFGLLTFLLWVSMRVIRNGTSLRSMGMAIIAAELPSVAIGAAGIVIVALASASGVDVGSGSTFDRLETIIAIALWSFYLAWATSAAAGVSVAKGALAVAMGPGVLFAMLLWLSFHLG